MSKRNSSNLALTIDQVMNDKNTQLVDEDCDRDEVEDDLGDSCWELDEESENNDHLNERFILDNLL